MERRGVKPRKGPNTRPSPPFFPPEHSGNVSEDSVVVVFVVVVGVLDLVNKSMFHRSL